MALQAFIDANSNPLTDNGADATFTALDLNVEDWEKLEIFIDGKIINNNELVDAIDDSGTVGEDGPGVVIDILDNDIAPDGVGGVTIVTGPPAGTVVINPDNTITFDPNGDFDYLADGETTTVTFVYELEDTDGDTDQATVTITITGTNDAPIIGIADNTGAVTELTDADAGENIDDLTDSGTIAFTDSDLSDSHTVSATDNGAGYIGSFTATISDPATGDGSGEVTWNFTVNDSLVDYLAVGETIVQSYDVTVDDGNGGTISETVTITITGTNDAPVIGAGDVTGEVTEIADLAPGENIDDLTDSGSLAFTDVDISDTHTVSNVANGVGFIGTFDAVINGGNIDWDFSVNDALVDYLAVNETIVQSYDVTVDDGNGGTDTETVTITITGTNDAPVITGGDTTGSVSELPDGDVGENTADLTDTGTLPFTDVDITDTHTVSSAENGAGYLGTFAAVINGSDIDWTFTVNDSLLDGLAAGEELVQSYDVTVDDGNGGTDTETVTITITGTNEAPVISGGDTTGDVTEIADLAPGENIDDLTDSGSLSFTDGDLSDTHTVSSSENGAGYIGSFAAVVNGSNIDWDFSVNDALLDSLGAGDTIVQSYDVTVDDGNGGTDTETVTITMTGTNDAPIIGSGDTTGSVTELADGAPGEGAANLTDNGSLAFTDVDLTDAHTVSVAENGAGYLGALTALVSDDTTGDGTGDIGWTFTVNDADVEYLAVGEQLVQSYDVTVDDGNGGTDTETVTITITGTNDAPTIGGGSSDTDGGVTELVDNAPGENIDDLTDSGVIEFADADLTDGHTVSSSANGAGYLGTFAATITDIATGDGSGEVTWDFSVNDSVLEGLAEGQEIIQTYDVTVDDGNGGTATETVTVTITGANDGPTAEDDDFSVLEDVVLIGNVLVDNGNGADSDPDILDSFSVVETVITTAQGGTVTIAANGAFTYNAPAEHFSGSDSFDYTIEDGFGAQDTATANISVIPDADVPDLVVISPARGNPGTDIPITIDVEFPDQDGSEERSILICHVPEGATFNQGIDNGDGSWSLTPAELAGLTINVSAATPAFESTYDLSELLPVNGGDGSLGFVINGIGSLDPDPDPNTGNGTVGSTTDNTAFDVANLGDVNGDGIDDFIVSAHLGDANGTNAGEAYVVFGNAAGFDAEFELYDLLASQGGDGSEGFAIFGIEEQDRAGVSVRSAGDVNGDGINDIMVGAPIANADTIDTGSSYVVFGSDTGFAAEFELSSIDGTNGYAINGDPLFITSSNDFTGYAQSGGYDIDGDGAADLLIGARGNEDPGRTVDNGSTYLVLGGEANLAASDLADGVQDGQIKTNELAIDGVRGFEFEGAVRGDQSGFAVSGVNDVNGDGVDDILIGARKADAQSGEAYLVFGGLSNLQNYDALDGTADGQVDLGLINGSNGYVFNGIQAGDQLGKSIADAGDINGDGMSDFIIGARDSDANGANSGEAYVVFGGLPNLQDLDLADGTDGQIDVGQLKLGDGSNGFVVTAEGAGDAMSRSVRSAGDINGDGINDLIIGSPYSDANGANTGSSYVVFGRTDGFGNEVDLADIRNGDGSEGFVIDGLNAQDQSGWAVSGAGDVNNDGIDDLIIGAFAADPHGLNSGEAYVIFGRQGLSSEDFTITVKATATETDNGDTETSTDTILIDLNEAPNIDDDSTSIDENSPNGTFVITAIGTDPDVGDTLDYAIIGGTGVGVFDIDITSGDITVIDGSALDFESIQSFTLVVEVTDDFGLTDAGIITINLNDVFENSLVDAIDDSGAVGEEGPGVVIDVLDNDDAPDGVGSVTIITGPSGGTATVNPGNTITFDPNGDFDYLADGETTTVTFVYELEDTDGDTDQATVTITITGTNDDPVITIVPGNGDSVDGATATQTVTLTQAQITDLATWSNINLTFPDNPSFIPGTVEDLSGTPDVIFEGAGTDELILGGTGQNELAGNGGNDIVFGGEPSGDPSPVLDFDDFIFAGDGDDLLVGGGGYDVFFVNRDGGHDLIVDGSTAVGGYSNGLVIFEGYDEDGEIDFFDEDGNDQGVREEDVVFTNNGDGTWTIWFANSTGSVTFASAEISEINLTDNEPGGTGGVTTAYTFNDGGTATDHSDDSYDMGGGGSETGAGVGVIETANGGLAAIEQDGSFIYTPAKDFSGVDSFDYTVVEPSGLTDTATVQITVTNENDAPVVEDVAITVGEDGPALVDAFVGDDPDLDDDPSSLDYAITSGPSEGSVINNNDGTFSFDPNGDFDDLAVGETRDVTFEYAATDSHGAVSNTGTVTVTVTGTNDDPIITVGAGDSDTGAVTELPDRDAGENTDDLTDTGSLSFGDVDLSDGHTVSTAPQGVGYLGALTAVITDPSTGDGSGQIDWTFTVNDSALDHLAEGEQVVQSYDVTVDDGNGGTDTETVTITIAGTNDAPVITGGDTAGGVTEIADGAPGETIDDVSDSGTLTFTDVDLSDSHTASFVENNTGYIGTFTASVNGGGVDWDFTVNDSLLDHLKAGETIIQSYDVTVDDGNGGADTETVTVTIMGTNDGPIAVDDGGFVPSALDLGTIDGESGAFIDGFAPNSLTGWSVSEAGDVNGDGIDDVIIGARSAGPEGSAFVVFGSADGIQNGIEVSLLDGTNGFRFRGSSPIDRTGSSVSGAGDINGDGIDDLVIGARFADIGGSQTGAAYVLFGSATGFASTIDPSFLNGSTGFVLKAEADGDILGNSVSSAGDVNGDGIDDLIVGALGADPNGSGSGSAYVVFGTTGGFSQTVDLDDLDGTNGFELTGGAAGDRLGSSVHSAGDVNGDGIDDLIVGAYSTNTTGAGTGSGYVVFGSSVGFDATISASTLDGTNGFQISGNEVNASAGASVSGLGDINGDGIDDLIIGVPGADPVGASSGTSYVVFGSLDSFGALLNVGSIDGTNGFRIDGSSSNDRSGGSVSSAGDVNGDGLNDILVGASNADDGGTNAGASYVIFGSTSEFDHTISLNSLDGSNGYRIDGASAEDFSGRSVSAAGDVNADGFGDLIVGSLQAVPGVSSTGPGTSHVVYGSNYQADEDDSARLIGNVLANDSDPDGDDLTVFSFDGTSALGAMVMAGAVDGTFVYDVSGVAAADALNDGETLTDTFDYTISDGNGGFDTATVTVTINGSTDNQLVLAVSDTAIAVEGGPVIDIDVLDNDDHPDGFGGISIITGPAEGSATVTLDNHISFDPGTDFQDLAPDETRDVTIVYELEDIDGDTDQATVTVTVKGAGSVPPVAVDDGGSLSSLNLISLDGTDGFRLDGEADGDWAGQSVSGAGDINGDGFDDVIIGASRADPNGNSSGSSYVVFGSGDGFAASYELSSLDGTTGFRIDGVTADDLSGHSVSGAGDVNGDGFDDLVIGAYGASPNGTSSGSSYILFGSAGGFAPTVDLSALNGTNGFRLDGNQGSDRSGYAVSGAGDVNGDGFDDLIVGAYGADPNGVAQSGSSYVVFGSGSGFTPSLDLSSLDGTNGFRLDGERLDDRSGRSLSDVGDVNGDGVDDLIIGAPLSDVNAEHAGSSYVVFGDLAGFAPVLDLSTLDGTNGFRLDGTDSFDWSGGSVSGVGDVNNDGVDDLIIGARLTDLNGSQSGSSYIVFGDAGGFAPTLNLSSLDGANGFRLDGTSAGDRVGASVSGAGDVNGDGIDDMIVGATGADPNGSSSGSTYVIFGSDNSFDATLDLSTIGGATGFRLDGANTDEQSGHSVSGAGDVNGDGFGDLIVGARYATPNGPEVGSTYVVFGSNYQADEDDSARLIGNVLANDSDPDGDVLTVSSFDGTSVLGATIMSGAVDGTFIYDVSGVAAADALGDGETLTDTFDYTVTDGNGGFDTATVTVTVTGANDAPEISFDVGGDEGAVTEDLDLLAAGDLDVFDPDTGAVLTWSLQGGTLADTSDYQFFLDHLSIDKNGTVDFYVDDFGDSTPPPSGGVYDNGDPGNYIAFGDYTETGGRLVYDGSLAEELVSQFFGTDGLFHNLTLHEPGPPSAAAISTLLVTDDFTYEGRYDLTLPELDAQRYGIRLFDADGDTTLLAITRIGEKVLVEFSSLDFVADTWTVIDSIELQPADGDNQIVLRLAHEVSSPGDVTASFDLLNEGVVTHTEVIPTLGQTFTDETWVRVQAVASSYETGIQELDGTYGTLTLNQNGKWLYTLDNDAAHVQALAAGEVVTETFTAVVTDEHGASDTEDIVITVNGVNDDPVAADDAFSGAEDTPFIGNVLIDNGNGADSDDDASDTLTVVETSITTAEGGTVTMAPNGDFTYVPFEHFSGNDSFTYTVSDGNGGTDTGTVTLTVIAVADQPIIVANTASGTTDTPVSVPLTIDFPDDDGSETHSITLSDVPDNATFNNGTNNGDGTWTLTKADLVGLEINVAPPGPIFGSTFALEGLTDAGGGDGSLGFVLNGSTGQDNNGFDVATAGDVNGDGFADILTSSVGGDAFGGNAGEVTIYFGGTTHAAETIISDTTTAQSYTFAGASAGDRMGTSVRSAGDINNDGFDDILIGSPLAAPDGNVSGRSYVVFGSAGNANFAAMDADDGTVDGLIHLAQLEAANGGGGSQGFILNGSPVSPSTSNEFTAYSTTGGFDFNGDGIDDLAIGATGNDFEDGVNPVQLDLGATYLVFGKATGFAAEIAVQDFMDPTNGAASAGTGDGSEGVVIRGFGVGEATGRQISGMQDMNGDGKNELLIGGRFADPNGNQSGQAYIVYGTDTLGAEFSLGDLDGTNGFIFNGMAGGDRLGRSINEAGDINGDGINDIIIGSYRADGMNGADSGEAYVIFGGQTNLAALDALDGSTDGIIETSELAIANGGDGTLDFILSGAEAQDRVGHVVRNAGDLNGDGFDDVLVGAPKANPDGLNDEGAVYVIFGTDTGFGAELDMGDLATGDGTVGFEIEGINGGDNAGWTAGAAGDVNGDGFDDIIIGATYADPNGASSGQTYVIYGKQDLSGDDFTITVEATATETSNSDTETATETIFFDLNQAPTIGDNAFAIVGGSGAGIFAIDGVSGDITVADGAALDFEVMPVFNLVVEVTDDFGQTDRGTVAISLNDVLEDSLVDAVDDSANALEDGPVIDIDVLDNDDHPDGFGGITIVTGPAEGTAAVTPDNHISFDPGADFQDLAVGETRDVTIVYEVEDIDGDADQATATVTVTGANDAPVAVDDSFTDLTGFTYNADNGHWYKWTDAELFWLDAAFAAFDEGGHLATITSQDENDFIQGLLDAGEIAWIGGDDMASEGTWQWSVGPEATNVFWNGGPVGGQYENWGPGEPNNGAGGNEDWLMIAADTGLWNDAPADARMGYIVEAGDDILSSEEDISILDTADILANDFDADGDPLTVTSVSGASAFGATVTLNGDGTVTYDPTGSAALQALGVVDSITYTISDGNGGFDTATVSGAVIGENDGPVANDDGPASTTEDTPVNIAVLANDTDIDGDALTVNQAAAANGTVVIEVDGSLTYTPDANFSGNDTVTYEISDGNGGTDTASVTVDVVASNDPPTAVDDAFSTDEDTAVVIDVAANDTDPDGDVLVPVGSTNPANGVLVFDILDGTYTYTPNLDFFGTDSFTYTISDGPETDTATVTITVNPVNDAPDANDEGVATDEGTAVIIDVRANDVDVDGDTMTVTGASDPANGSVVVNPDNTITYTPDPGFDGNDSFTYTITDGNGEVDTATVSVTVSNVNQAPVAVDDFITIDEDSGPVALNLFGNDTDPDGDPILAHGSSNPAHGALTYDGTTQTYFYDPGAGFSGTDSFTYTVQDADGAVSNSATVYLTIAPVNNAPPIAVDDAVGFSVALQSAIGVSDLVGSNGFRLDGNAEFDGAGSFVSGAGDINDDGFDDFLISAEFDDSNGGDAGAVYVVFGTDQPFTAFADLSTIDGTNGFRIDGENAGDTLGRGVSDVGDLNGDGIDDMVVGSRDGAYVVFGTDQGFGAALDVASLNGANGFAFSGFAGIDHLGGLSGIGDVNADGIDDLLVSVQRFLDNPGPSDYAYVVFGTDQGFSPNLTPADLDGSNGFAVQHSSDDVDNGNIFSGSGGRAVSGAGDLNGDGAADFIVADKYSDLTAQDGGNVFVVFGSAGASPATFDLAGLDGSNGFRLDGLTTKYTIGDSVSSLGDVNGDGFDDIIVNASPPLNSYQGLSYVIFGTDAGFAPVFDQTALDGSNGFTIDGATPGDVAGIQVSGAGDVNGDGIADMLVGAFGVSTEAEHAGAVYVVYGNDQGFAPRLDLGALDGMNGYRIDGAAENDALGLLGVSGAGDVNGDGFDDIVLGTSQTDHNGNNSDSGYVIYGFDTEVLEGDGTYLIANVLGNDSDPGGDSLSVASFDATSALGATITAGAVEGTFVYDVSGVAAVAALAEGETLLDTFAYSVTDGNDGTDAATVTITIRGESDGLLAVSDIIGSPGEDIIAGTEYGDTLNGGAGNDILTGNGGDDLFVFENGTGDDVITDFSAGAGSEDVIDVSDFGFTDLADLLAVTNDSGADTVITLDGDDSLTLIGVQEANLHEDDFLL